MTAICFAILIIVGIYILIKLARSNMVVPAGAEQYVSPRSREYVQYVVWLKE